VPTTLIHETARQLYPEYIEHGVFSLALDASTLLESIRSKGRENPGSEREPYIRTESTLAEDALRTLLAAGSADMTGLQEVLE
jgi:hypothetical protein